MRRPILAVLALAALGACATGRPSRREAERLSYFALAQEIKLGHSFEALPIERQSIFLRVSRWKAADVRFLNDAIAERARIWSARHGERDAEYLAWHEPLERVVQYLREENGRGALAALREAGQNEGPPRVY